MPTADLMPMSGVALYLVMLVAIAESLNRFRHTSPETSRKIVHIGAGQVLLLAWWLQIPAWEIIGASVVASIIALVSYVLPILPSINSVGRKSLGTFFYAVSIGLVALCFFPDRAHFAVIGILIMAWGDGLAAIIGQRFGRHPYHLWGNRKSMEGTGTMAIASLLVTGLILTAVYGASGSVWLVAFGVAIAATGLEAISQLGIDNLTVPLGSAFICAYLSHWL